MRTSATRRSSRAGRSTAASRSGFAAPAAFVHRLPEGFADLDAAPLLCAGIIGFRCLRRTGIRDWRGARLGIYGFGAAGHVAIPARPARAARTSYVATRDRDRERHQALASESSALRWVRRRSSGCPVALDAAIVFAPAGEIVSRRPGDRSSTRAGRSSSAAST
jgi:propanol-preferring alcohol dehydrogenase